MFLFLWNLLFIWNLLLGGVPKPNRNHVASADGCGALGVKISTDFLPFAAMEKCCNAHDICYDTCNKDKEACDVEFKRCLYKHCDSYSQSVGGQTMTKSIAFYNKKFYIKSILFQLAKAQLKCYLLVRLL